MGKAENRNTALLYFIRSASEEAELKCFCGSEKSSHNRSIAQELIDNTYRELCKVDLPVITISSEKQIGSTFGERFSNAFKSLFDAGYGRVIAVGCDSPRLTSSIIKNAATTLQEKDAVLGPSTDGGAYLIGLNREVFESASLVMLPWETNRLYDTLTALLETVSAVTQELPCLDDIDTSKDFYAFLSSPATEPSICLLIKKIFAIINGSRWEGSEITSPEMLQPFFSLTALRAPPLFTRV